MTLFRLPVAACIILIAVLAGCASVDYSVVEPALYEGAIEELQQELRENPDSAEARRSLGLIYLRTGAFRDARTELQAAYDGGVEDPEALFSLGLAHERSGEQRAAIEAYRRYTDLPRTSRYREPMQGRYLLLARQVARAQVRRALAAEATLTDQAPARHVVGVVPLSYQGREPRFEPLGEGLAEMIAIDLAQVQQLRVVERVRLDAVLDELELGASDVVAVASAPRTGRLLGAGRLVAGTYDVLDEETLRLDAALWEMAEAEEPGVESRTDALEQLFAMQKQLVFSLIERMGIRLTAEERARIGEVPTDDLEAFLEFARGLAFERQGQYTEAAQAFSRAAVQDPSFAQATEAQARAQGMQTATGDAASFQRTTLVPAVGPAPIGAAPLSRRLQELSIGLGADDVPGDPDERRPAPEVSDEPPRLPDPPPPPSN